MSFANEDVYDGDYYEDHIEGEGVFKYHNGDVCYGEYVAGKRHGRNRYVYASGTIDAARYESDTQVVCNLHATVCNGM